MHWSSSSASESHPPPAPNQERLDGEALARLSARCTILKALSHPTRLFMVEVLARGERCVCDLTAMVGADISTVSKHLAQLKTAGIVEDQKRGLQVYYSLRMPCVLRFLACADELICETGQGGRRPTAR